jgi:hypothetical protein
MPATATASDLITVPVSAGAVYASSLGDWAAPQQIITWFACAAFAAVLVTNGLKMVLTWRDAFGGGRGRETPQQTSAQSVSQSQHTADIAVVSRQLGEQRADLNAITRNLQHLSTELARATEAVTWMRDAITTKRAARKS